MKRLLIFLAMLIIASPCAAQQIRVARSVALTELESKRQIKDINIYTDRLVYWPEDGVIHALVTMLQLPVDGKVCKVSIAKAGAQAPPNQRRSVKLETGKLELIADIRQIQPGEYTIRAEVEGINEAAVETTIRVEASARKKAAEPDAGIILDVQPQSIDPDGAWPITTGVPMPAGLLEEGDSVTLFEEGRAVGSQFSTLTTWEPAAPGFKPHVRWGRLSFISRYDGGKPLRYTLHIDKSTVAGPKVSVETSAATITVDTGAVKFVVDRKSFDGIHEAWRDVNGDGNYGFGEVAIAPADQQGPYVVDEAGNMYLAKSDSTARVEVEESGPIRAVIVAEG